MVRCNQQRHNGAGKYSEATISVSGKYDVRGIDWEKDNKTLKLHAVNSRVSLQFYLPLVEF